MSSISYTKALLIKARSTHTRCEKHPMRVPFRRRSPITGSMRTPRAPWGEALDICCKSLVPRLNVDHPREISHGRIFRRAGESSHPRQQAAPSLCPRPSAFLSSGFSSVEGQHYLHSGLSGEVNRLMSMQSPWQVFEGTRGLESSP